MFQTPISICRSLLLIGSLLLLAACHAPSEPQATVNPTDWPGFQGPTHDLRVLPDGLDVSLTDTQDRIVWRQKVGLGYTVAAIADGLGYTAGWADGTTTLRCFDPATGAAVWTFDYDIHQYDQRGEWPKSNEGGPVVTPAVHRGKLVHTTRDGRIFCLDAKTGKLLWQNTFSAMFDVPEPRWGFSASPIAIDGVLYLDVGKIVAINLDDGSVRWQTKDYTQSYASPTPFSYNGTDYLAAFPLQGLVVVERDTGKVAAHFPWESNQPCHAASPVVFEGNHIFISSGFNSGGSVLRFTGDTLEQLWVHKDLCNTTATSLYHEGHLFGFDQKVLRCVDAMTGEEKWSQRGLGAGTLLAVGETMLVFSEGGEIMAAPMNPEGFTPGPKTRLIFETRVWSCPVIAEGRLYVRGARGDLVCVDLRAERAAAR